MEIQETTRQSTVDRRAVAVAAVVGVLLVVWFLFAWLGLQRNAVDAAGESVGSGFLLLVLVAIVGVVRRSR